MQIDNSYISWHLKNDFSKLIMQLENMKFYVDKPVKSETENSLDVIWKSMLHTPNEHRERKFGFFFEPIPILFNVQIIMLYY